MFLFLLFILGYIVLTLLLRRFVMFKTTKTAHISEIEQTIRNYFQGYLRAEPETLLKAFHHNAKLQSTENGALGETQILEWLQNIRERKEKGDIRKADAQILGIDVSGEAAVVKTKLIFTQFSFTDYLSLLRLNDGWIIVNKIYTTQQS